MPEKYQDTDEGNRLYQRDLAKALVASFGSDAALEACESNGWEGVCRILPPPRHRSRNFEPGDRK